MIATVTFNPAIDYTATVDGALAPGRVGRTDEYRYDAGGKGINVSKFLAALDVETVATAPVGGFLGEFLREELSDRDVPADVVDVDGRTRLNVTLHAEDGEFKVNQRGPELDDDAVSAVLDVLRTHDPDTLVVAGSLPPGLDVGAIDRVAGGGTWEAVVDVGGDELAALERSYALCKPNREELAAATGRTVETTEDAVEAARALRERGFDAVLASLGADGAVLVTADDAIVRGAPETTVRDTVGAGDALLAGYLSADGDGATPEEALDRGLEVAAAVVAVRGPSAPDDL